MDVAADIIMALSIEQAESGPSWPHPWDHYPFVSNGRPVWLRYQELDSGQRELVQTAIGDGRPQDGAPGCPAQQTLAFFPACKQPRAGDTLTRTRPPSLQDW